MLHDRNKKLSDRRVKEHMKSDKDLKRKKEADTQTVSALGYGA